MSVTPTQPFVGHDFSRDLTAVARIGSVEKILEVICRTTGMGFSAVARVTGDRWVACAVRDEIAFGLKPGSELKVQTTLCNEVRDSGQLIVIDHVAQDSVFCNHHTPRMYGFQSYISVPINLSSGRFFGTLCAIDPKPAKLKTPETIGMFTLFAELIARHLDSQDHVDTMEQALKFERETAQFREQFIAVLGHDLRNPLAAIHSGTALLRHLPHDATAENVLGIIQRSVQRMTGLINNVLDFARGRLGGGFRINRVVDTGLAPALTHVVSELQTAYPTRTIHSNIAVDLPIACDNSRIAQMLSNLLANALTHGDPEGPVTVNGQIVGETFELSVTNLGKDVPPDTLERLFQPFARGRDRSGVQGLGLGLYISTEIAKAHDGTLSVTSARGQTTFTFRMPIALKAATQSV